MTKMPRPKKIVFNCKVLWYVRAFHVLLEHYVKMEATNVMLEQFLEPAFKQKHISINTCLSAQSDLEDFIKRKVTKTQLLEFLEHRKVLPFTFNADSVASWDKDEAESDLRVAKAALAEYRRVRDTVDMHYTMFKE